MRPLDLHLGRPLTRGALTVFPIWNGLGRLGRGYLSLGGYFEAALVWQTEPSTLPQSTDGTNW